MGLQDYDPESVDEDDPKLQAIIFPNPEDEEMQKYINDPEQAEEMYVAARWLKNRLGTNSSVLVGKFIRAARKADEEDDYEELEEMFETLKGEDDA